MNTLFLKYIDDKNLFKPSDKLLLGVSGGVDSMVLFDLLYKNNFDFVVCYIDHDKRPDSINDYKLIENLCANKKIPFYTKKLSYENKKIENFQNFARNERYNFFIEIAEKLKISYILTAHHLDDLAETILLKLERGSNLFGYTGFVNKYQKNGFYFVKPLLSFDKESIYAYSRTHAIKFLEDSTNQSTIYKRNHYRNEIIPLLKSNNAHLLKKYYDFSEQLHMSFKYIRKQTLAFLTNGLIFSQSEFMSLDNALKYDVINYIFESLKIHSSYNKITLFINLIENNQKKNIFQIIGNNIYMIKAYDKISFKQMEHHEKISIKIDNLEALQKIDNEYIYFSHNKPKNSLKYLKICYNNIDFPLALRTRELGDYLEFNYGKKKLKKFFIDNKIDKETRDTALLLTSKNKVLWMLDLNVCQAVITEIDGYLIYKK